MNANPAAILALLSSLVEQVAELTADNERLRAALEQMAASPSGEP